MTHNQAEVQREALQPERDPTNPERAASGARIKKAAPTFVWAAPEPSACGTWPEERELFSGPSLSDPTLAFMR